MIAMKNNGDKPDGAANIATAKKAEPTAGTPAPVTPPPISLRIAREENGRAVLPDKLVDPAGVFQQPMVLPGLEGLPFRGDSIPNLKEDDPDALRPKIGQQIFADVLDLSEPKDMRYYQQVMQLVGNGFAQLSVEERKYDNAIKSWRVFIRWILYYGYMVQTPGAKSDG